MHIFYRFRAPLSIVPLAISQCIRELLDSRGTNFVDESNVNSMALEYGGMNANKLIVQDESKILDIDVGDIFFMKGHGGNLSAIVNRVDVSQF